MEKSDTSLSINPSFSVRNVKFQKTFQLDSGVNDINRTVLLNEPIDSDIRQVLVSGFDTYYVVLIQAILKNPELELNDTHAYIKKGADNKAQSLSSDEIVVVQGKVELVLSNGGTIQLCKPVYRIHPVDDKHNTFPANEDLCQFIKTVWMDEVKNALFTTGYGGGNVTTTSSGNTQTPILTKVLAGVFCLMLLAVGVLFLTGGSSDATANSQEVADNAASNSDYYPSFLSDNTQETENPSEVDADYYKKMQYDQTKEMLSKMGVDLDGATSNLGCLTN